MNRALRFAPLLAPLLALGGCVTLLPPPPPAPRIFTLEAADVAVPEAEARIDAVVAIAAPNGERSLLGVDMVWRTGDELAFVAQTQWSNRADAALQAMLIETLARQERFRAVGRVGEARADYEIRWDVLDFEIVQDNMEARFVANVQVLALPGRRVIAQRIISAAAPVSDRSASDAAEALTRAAREGSARIGVFAAEAAASAPMD
jgi:ABC-type uncharacterized transport system auxiliary subunit